MTHILTLETLTNGYLIECSCGRFINFSSRREVVEQRAEKHLEKEGK